MPMAGLGRFVLPGLVAQIATQNSPDTDILHATLGGSSGEPERRIELSFRQRYNY
jgi:hypothetical protein